MSAARLVGAVFAALLLAAQAFAQQTVVATAPAANLPLPVRGAGAPGLPAGGVASIQGVPGGTPVPVQAVGPLGAPVSVAGTVTLGFGALGPPLVATGSIGATVTAIKTAPGTLQGYYFYNANTSVAYVQFFAATTANVTLGTTAPFMSLGIPASSGANIWFAPLGIPMAPAISVAITTTRAGSSGPSSTVDYNIFYN